MFESLQPAKESNLTLNITSLMDVLTIVLIFLIFNFDSEAQKEITPPQFELPSSNAERKSKLTVRVAIGPDDIRVEEKVVASLSAGRVRTGDLDRGKNIGGLLRALKKEKARLNSEARVDPGPGGEDETEIVYFEAAKDLPYETINRVMQTTATAGFAKFRLAVLQKE